MKVFVSKVVFHKAIRFVVQNRREKKRQISVDVLTRIGDG